MQEGHALLEDDLTNSLFVNPSELGAGDVNAHRPWDNSVEATVAWRPLATDRELNDNRLPRPVPEEWEFILQRQAMRMLAGRGQACTLYVAPHRRHLALKQGAASAALAQHHRRPPPRRPFPLADGHVISSSNIGQPKARTSAKQLLARSASAPAQVPASNAPAPASCSTSSASCGHLAAALPAAASPYTTQPSPYAQPKPGSVGRGSKPYLFAGTPSKFYPRWAKERSPYHGPRPAPTRPLAATQTPTRRTFVASPATAGSTAPAHRRAPIKNTPPAPLHRRAPRGFSPTSPAPLLLKPPSLLRIDPDSEPDTNAASRVDHRALSVGQFFDMGPKGLGCERWTGCGPTRKRAPALAIWASALEEGSRGVLMGQDHSESSLTLSVAVS